MTIGGYRITLSGDGGWLEALLFVVVLVLAFRAYGSVPQGVRVNRILLGIRSAVLLLLVGLMFAPRVVVEASGVRKPLIAILVDDSESMRIQAGDRPRYAVVDSMLQRDVFDVLTDRARVRFYAFSDALQVAGAPDTARWLGSSTDVSTSLDQLVSHAEVDGLSGVVLLSDGAHNRGEAPGSPGWDVGVPVYAVPIGDDAPPVDASVTSVIHLSLAHVGSRVDVKAMVEVSGIERRAHTIRLYDGETVVARQPIVLSPGEQEVHIPFVAKVSGRRSLRVEIPELSEEAETSNNKVLSEIEVLEGRERILLAGIPSADFAYVRRLVEADSNGVVDVVFPDSPDGWPFRARENLRNAGSYDLVILHDVPGALLSGEIVTTLKTSIKDGGGLLVIGGEHALVDGWGKPGLDELLPVNTSKSLRIRQPMVVQPASGPPHPILVGGVVDNIQDGWKQLPPVLGGTRFVSGAPEGRGHVVLTSEDDAPLVVARDFGNGRVVVVGARTFSRQALLMWGVGSTDRIIHTFWKRTVRWLLTKGSVEKLRVSTDRREYRSGEPITLRVELYDSLLDPVDGAEVTAIVEGTSERRSALSGKGNGIYEARLPGLAQGEHGLIVTATSEEVEERVVDRITVGRYSIEYEHLLPNLPMLQAIADLSGGQVVRLDALDDFLSSLRLSPQPYTSTHNYQLWGHTWPLVLLTGLLALEWFVRRRRGMV